MAWDARNLISTQVYGYLDDVEVHQGLSQVPELTDGFPRRRCSRIWT